MESGSVNRPRTRPPRDEVGPAALDLIARHGPEILRTARRHSANPDDAEDAYQRGLEILLTKAPTTSADELVPWLKTVVKHEAWAIRRARERAAPVTGDGRPPDRAGAAAQTQESVERFERLFQSAEALRRLKPQELRALVLRAEGYSYRQICDITGWSYTKVNRCVTEGRRAFLTGVAGIESGAECERLAPRLSALADGEASADDLAALRPHLRTCLACRARLREHRAAPARVAALVPPGIAAVAGVPAGPPDMLDRARAALESALGALQDRVVVLGDRAHGLAELAAGNKMAAVAASAVAVAGGGAGVHEATVERPAPAPQRVADTRPDPTLRPTAPPAPASAPVTAAAPPQAKPSPPDPAFEFEPPAPRPPASASFEPGVEVAEPDRPRIRSNGGNEAAGSGAEFTP
jgi:RNA polymerase sigma factor (sigma-70 family)